MPKRYTDAEVSTIVQESQELREYVKNMITNQQDYVSEMKIMRERNTELNILVGDLRKELTDQQTAFIEAINKTAEGMVKTVDGVRPDIDWIRDEAKRSRNQSLEGANSMWLLNMLGNSHPDYVRDLVNILERGERRGHREERHDRRFNGSMGYNPIPNFSDLFKSGSHKDDFPDAMLGLMASKPTQREISSMAESLKNLGADDKKINPNIADEPKAITPKKLKDVIGQISVPLNIIEPPLQKSNKKKL